MPVRKLFYRLSQKQGQDAVHMYYVPVRDFFDEKNILIRKEQELMKYS